MYQNENGEYVIVRTYTNEDGETVKQYKTYQNNGWVRVNQYYSDGYSEEWYKKE